MVTITTIDRTTERSVGSTATVLKQTALETVTLTSGETTNQAPEQEKTLPTNTIKGPKEREETLLRTEDTAVVVMLVVVMVVAAVVVGMVLKESAAVTRGIQEDPGRGALAQRERGHMRSGRTAVREGRNLTRVAVTR